MPKRPKINTTTTTTTQNKKQKIEPQNVWNVLPSELMVYIFKKNSESDDCRAALVCRRWAEIRRKHLINFVRYPQAHVDVFTMARGEMLGFHTFVNEMASKLGLFKLSYRVRCCTMFITMLSEKHVPFDSLFEVFANLTMGFRKDFLVTVTENILKIIPSQPCWETEVLGILARRGRTDAMDLWTSSRKGFKRRIRARKHIQPMAAGSVQVMNWLSHNKFRPIKIDEYWSLYSLTNLNYKLISHREQAHQMLETLSCTTNPKFRVWLKGFWLDCAKKNNYRLIHMLPFQLSSSWANVLVDCIYQIICYNYRSKTSHKNTVEALLYRLKEIQDTGIVIIRLDEIYQAILGMCTNVFRQYWILCETYLGECAISDYYKYCKSAYQIEWLIFKKVPLKNWHSLSSFTSDFGKQVLLIFQQAKTVPLPRFPPGLMINLFSQKAFVTLNWIYQHMHKINWCDFKPKDCTRIVFRIEKFVGDIRMNQLETCLYELPKELPSTYPTLLNEAKKLKQWLRKMPHETVCEGYCKHIIF